MTNNRTRKEHLSYSRIARLYARLRLSQAKTNYPAAIRVVKVQSSRFIRMRVLREVKNGRLALSRTNRKRSSFATKHFQKKSLKIFDLHPPLGKLLSFVARISAFKVRCWVTDTQTHTHTQTHRPSTVTLAAHAHRGLIILENVEHCGGEPEQAGTGILCHCHQ